MASSATLRPARSTPPSSSVTVYEPCGPRARRARRSSPTGARARRSPASRRSPGSSVGSDAAAGRGRLGGVEAGHGARQGVRVEARPGVAVAGRAGRLRADQQRVAVAVERERAEAQHVARRLALAPQPAARPGVEVDLARCRASRPAPRRPASRPSAPGRRRRPGRRPPRGLRRPSGPWPGSSAAVEVDGARAGRARLMPDTSAVPLTGPDGQPGGRHHGLDLGDRDLAAVEDPGREHRVGAAVADRLRRSRSGPAAPPEAMTGTRTRDGDRRAAASVSKPDLVPSRSIEVTSSSPAPSSTARTRPVDRVEADRLAAALDHDLEPGRDSRGVRRRDPARVDRHDDGLRPEPRRARG